MEHSTPKIKNTKHPIILVDDAHEILNLLEEQLLELGHEVRAFQDPLKAADALRNGTESYCCILTDYDMPGINGLDLLQVANEHQPLASRIMISGHADLSLAMKAINEGSIFRFMLKPWKLNELKQIVDESVARFEETEEKHLMQEQLKLLNLELSAANLRLHENLEELTHFSRHLMTTFSPLLGETTRIVCDLCEEFCQLGIFDEQQQRLLRLAAVFHNVGLINTTRMTVKKSFLKPRQLTREEARIVQLHPEYPESLLHFRGELEPVTKIIRAHHERWDGSGYPDGLSRNTIPYLSNFLALACYYAECDSYRDEVIVRIRDLKNHAFSEEAVSAFNQVVGLRRLPSKIKELRAQELHSGLILAAALYTKEAVLLLDTGKELTRSMLGRIKADAEANLIPDSVLVKA